MQKKEIQIFFQYANKRIGGNKGKSPVFSHYRTQGMRHGNFIEYGNCNWKDWYQIILKVFRIFQKIKNEKPEQ